MADQQTDIPGAGAAEVAAVSLTQLIMQAEPDGPDGKGWNRVAIFRTYRRCVYVINAIPRKGTTPKA